MSIRVLCLSGLIAAFAAGSALSADYNGQRPSPPVAQHVWHRQTDRLPFELKVLWRQEERSKLMAMPREQRRGWLRAEWSRMSERQKQAKTAELQAKWDALPPNVRQTVLEKKRQKQQARRMRMMQNARGTGGDMGRSAGQTPH